MTEEQIFGVLGSFLIAGGGGAAVAYGIFKSLGQKWIESKFSTRLETFKHQQNKELQRLKIEIDSMLSGSIKLQELEFKTFPELWNKISEAYVLAEFMASPIREYPELLWYSDEELEEFFSNTKLLESQKDQIRKVPNGERVSLYGRFLEGDVLVKTHFAINEARNYINKNGIFFTEELKLQSDEIISLLLNAFLDCREAYQSQDQKIKNDAWREFKSQAEPLYKAIEYSIQKRLRLHSGRSS